ncbi:hypothetical protein [Streptomyces fuscichromogenes]|uniref:Uncharacterized protein n=1 Tax=Streptomyces fuscichromogenes TaxID=1324013 RepID=A0A918CXY4_9ACTN|nr:hypothetical protein [Streptomyces fuscichromogenes]GGN47755.1 hypothetical protein GCM10011578_101510 [Streptomyces fuscichromogenes]
MSNEDTDIKGPISIQQVEQALAALGANPAGGTVESPVIAVGQLLALCEFIAVANTMENGAVDQDGLKDLMHGYYGMVVAMAHKLTTDSSGLRARLAENRLHRTASEADLAGEGADQLSLVLAEAITEIGRLHAQGNIL